MDLDRRRASHLAILLLLVAAAIWPYRYILPLLPISRDAILWVTNADPAREGFLEWTFASRHFRVGYRPLTALSFTLDHLIVGTHPLLYRITDLLLHGGCVVATWAVFRRLWSETPRRGMELGALVAAMVVAGHPLGEEVVPHLARRGYPMVSLLSLAAILATPRPGPTGAGHPGRALAAAGLATAAAATHEVGYLAYPLILVVALWGRPLRDGIVAQRVLLLATGLLAPASLLVRGVVVGGLGGYRSADAGALEILWATAGSLAPIVALRAPLAPGTSVAVVLSVLWLAVLIAVALPEVRRPGGMVVALLWLVGLIVLYLPQGVWFPRQVYVLLPPLGMLLGGVLAGADGVRQVPAVMFLVAMGVRAPLWGVDPQARSAQEHQSALLADLTRAASAAPRGSELVLVVPWFEAPSSRALRARTVEERGGVNLGSRSTALWVQRTVPHRGAEVAVLYSVSPGAEAPLASLVQDGAAFVLQPPLPDEVTILGRARARSDGSILVPVPPASATELLLYFYDGDRGVLHPMSPPVGP
ncbi:MAG TPA: hypothetical protein ENK18_18190 [Deltaproteobacteria bacterium]|nr:hypothetical protein [Deltaproteobacteria bacterium]